MTVTVAESGFGAPWFPAVPVKVGVVLLVAVPFVGAVIATVGAVVSITNVFGVLVPMLPRESVCVACAV